MQRLSLTPRKTHRTAIAVLSTIALTLAVLYADGKTAVMDGTDLGKVKVDAVVAEHVKGPKLRVNTYRPKKRFKRRMGHRSHLSRLEIRKITGPTAATRAKKEPAKTEAKED